LKVKGLIRGAVNRAKCSAGFTLVEAMVAIAILAIGLLGVGYTLHVSFSMGQENIRTLHRPADEKGELGLRDQFNKDQATIYGKLQ